jgi:hypothetical protein
MSLRDPTKAITGAFARTSHAASTGFGPAASALSAAANAQSRRPATAIIDNVDERLDGCRSDAAIESGATCHFSR